MNGTRGKKPRLRLDADSYRDLCRRVLNRDAWRCQFCGRMHQLEVHHRQPRSRSGDDVEENLITLCAECHARTHRKKPDMMYKDGKEAK
jgi:5-methylcytosine-specific restriction endonuclease McrA